VTGWLAVLLLVGSGTAAAQEQTVAIVGGTVLPGEGAAIENATVVIRGERIVSVTAGGAVPAGARRIEAAGRIVTPGFVGVDTAIGLVEVDLENATHDDAPEEDDADEVRAAFAAADGVNPGSTLIPVARLGGVTSAVSTPQRGLVSGTSAWIDLRGERPAELVALRHAALHVHLDDGGIESAGGAMPMAITRLREILADARLYARQRAAYDRRGLREMQVSRLDLERLGDALARRIPVVIHVTSAADILRAIEIGREHGLRIILSGVQEGWRVADAIAAAEVPVILQPLSNMPETFRRLGSRYDNAAILHQAGVRIVFKAEDAHQLTTLRQEAGNAVAWGVPRDVALRAITTEPARLFGLERDYGAVAPGRIANLVVWNGDPFELSTAPVAIFVRGQEMPLRSRQTELFERYRNPSTLRR
jgi:imidazolonepropionase-like amidohydrolase